MDNSPVRYGMYKNFRIGVVKYHNRGVSGAPSTILVEVVESCNGVAGTYFATYNLNIEIDRRYAENINASCVGRWILFGFYVQSFRSQDGFVTALKLRHYEELDGETQATIEVMDHRSKEDNNTRSILVPDTAMRLMNEISEKTKFNEYGKR